MAGLTQAALAKRVGISATALDDVERENTPLTSILADAIRAALELEGLDFIAENGGGPGVRLSKGGARGDAAGAIPVEELTSENDE